MRYNYSMVYNCDVFGDWLALRMETLGLTQEQVAVAVGPTQQTVSKWLGNKSRPSARWLVDLSRVLDVSLEELVTQLATAASLPEEGGPVADDQDELRQRVERLEAEVVALRQVEK